MPRSAAAWEHAEKHRPKFIAWLKAGDEVKTIAFALHQMEWTEAEKKAQGKELTETEKEKMAAKKAAWKAAHEALSKAHEEMLEEEEAAKKKKKPSEQKKGGTRKTRRRRTARK